MNDKILNALKTWLILPRKLHKNTQNKNML